MTEPPKNDESKHSNKNMISKRRAQLRWFVDKLLSLSKNPITLDDYNEFICLPVELLKKEGTGLFPLGRLAGSVSFDSVDQEYASYCSEMLEKIKSDIYKLENKYLHFNAEKFSWTEDPNYYGYGYAFFIDYDHVPLIEAYIHFMNGDKGETKLVRLQGKKVEFNEDTSTISIDGKKCPLPAAKNEDYLARHMFSREVNEPVDWSIIYKEMTGNGAVLGSKTDKKALVDTINRLNDRIKKIFGTEDRLISCENNNVKRNF